MGPNEYTGTDQVHTTKPGQKTIQSGQMSSISTVHEHVFVGRYICHKNPSSSIKAYMRVCVCVCMPECRHA